MTRLTPGKLPHLLLSVACAEPMTRRELQARAERRGRIIDDPTASWACCKLLARGFLRVEGARPTNGNSANLYVLTPAGEKALEGKPLRVARVTYRDRISRLLATLSPLLTVEIAAALEVPTDVMSVHLHQIRQLGVVRAAEPSRRQQMRHNRNNTAWELVP